MSVWVLSEGYVLRMVNPGVEGGAEEWAAKRSMEPEYDEIIYFFAELVNEDVPTVPLNTFKGTYAIAEYWKYGNYHRKSFNTVGEAVRWLSYNSGYGFIAPEGVELSDGSVIKTPYNGGSQVVWDLLLESGTEQS